mmetsp:Transcript_35736/g.34768  ORF Transcript_35736/g.34768 Transcript_35736/m.34768 type:complete len:183 (-) Transcript_35736:1321-1869(-)
MTNQYLSKKRGLKKALQVIAQRTIKSTIAILSLWFPSLIKFLREKNLDQAKLTCANVMDKMFGASSKVLNQEEKVVEIVITPDKLTTGMFEDFQLIIQLVIDQFFLTLKVLSKKGMTLFTHKKQLAPLDADGLKENQEGIVIGVVKDIKNTLMAFLSFTMYKLIFNLSSFPKQLKIETKRFL